MLEILIIGSIFGIYLVINTYKCTQTIINNRLNNQGINEIPVIEEIYINNISPNHNPNIVNPPPNIVNPPPNPVNPVNQNPPPNPDKFTDFSIVYKYKVSNNDYEECSICLENIKNDDTVRQLKCFHIYHKHCITEWLNNKKICPECNYEF